MKSHRLLVGAALSFCAASSAVAQLILSFTQSRASLGALRLTGLLALLTCTAHAQLVFTQYYEGASFNKWVEVKNVGSSSIDLSAYTVSLYTNAAAENWKTGTTTTFNLALTGTLAAGNSFLMAHSSATAPFASATANVASSTVINFNGNDSIVLWNDSAAFSTGQIVDALSFTNLGNEGANVSFVRSSLDVGYDLVGGTSIVSHSGIWTSVAYTTVDAAVAGTDNYLGYSSLAAVPEPSTYAAIVGMLALAGAIVRRRFVRA